MKKYRELTEPYLLTALRVHRIMPLSDLKPFIWRDVSGDLFLLTKYCEIYLETGYEAETIGSAVCGLYIWSKKMLSQCKKSGLFYDFWSTDDKLDLCKTRIENIPLILQWGAFKRRPHLKGKWIKSREEHLAHRILPYRGWITDEDRVAKGLEAPLQASLFE